MATKPTVGVPRIWAGATEIFVKGMITNNPAQETTVNHIRIRRARNKSMAMMFNLEMRAETNPTTLKNNYQDAGAR